MKPLKDVIDFIVDNNLKLPTFIWFKHSITDEVEHLGSITSIYNNTIVINYLESKHKSCQHKMFISINHTNLVAEVDTQVGKDYTNG